MSRKSLEEEVASILKPSSMESLVNVSKAPQDDVEAFSESHDEMVTIPEYLGDEVNAAPEFPRDDAAEDDLEEDAKSARSQIIKYENVFEDLYLMICTLGKFFNRIILAFVLLLASWSYHYMGGSFFG